MPLFCTFRRNPCGPRNVYVEPRELESLCGTVVEPGTLMKLMEPQKCGTLGNLKFMWNLSDPGTFEPWGTFLSLEPLCGTLGYLVPGFGRLPRTTPKLYWKNPKLFKLWGKNETSFFKGRRAPQISTVPDFFSCRLPPQVWWNLVEPQLVRVDPLCGTWLNLKSGKWNLYVEPCGT